MERILFIIFCWGIIIFMLYTATQNIKLIKSTDIKLLANVIFYSISAVIVTLTFIVEYLKK